MLFTRALSMLLLSGFTTSTANLRPYVSPPELLPAGVAARAPEILPGIVVVVAEASQDGFLSGFSSRSTMREIAIQNLRKLPLPTYTKSVAVEGRADADIFLFEQQDSFVAARITFLDELAAGVAPEQPRSNGFLIAIPRRRTLLLHIPRGPGVLKALPVMARTAGTLFRESAASRLSPHVYYVAPDGRAQIVANADNDDAVTILQTGMFGELLAGPNGLLKKP